MKIKVDIEGFLENIETYAVDEEYDYTYYLVSYELQRMQIPKMIGGLKPEHMVPILLFLREWMPGGWINWCEKTGKWWHMNSKLCHALNDLHRDFNRLNDVNLMQFNPDLHGNYVVRIFGMINDLEFASSEKAIATVTSKIIHLFSPELLVMWDSNVIRDSGFQPNADGYLHFLSKMKELAEQLQPYLDRINSKAQELKRRATEIYGEQICSEKSLAKFIDENNWIKSRKHRRSYR